MKLRMLAVFSLVLAFSVLSHAGDAKKDKEKLQGKWLADDKKLELTFTGDNFVITIEGQTGKGTFKLDPSKTPREMDMKVTEFAEAEVVGKTALAVYDFDGDKLKWLSNGPGQAERPKEFPAKEGQGMFYYAILKRVK